MSEEITILKSERGKDICILDGYIYNITTFKDGVHKYRCRSRSCKGSILLDAENKKIGGNEHNHTANLLEANKLKVLSAIKLKTLDTNELPENIVHNSIRELNVEDEIIIHLPKLKSLKDSIKKSRNKALRYYHNIINEIPETLKFDKDGNRFLQYDSGRIDDRFIIFFSKFKFDLFKKKRKYF